MQHSRIRTFRLFRSIGITLRAIHHLPIYYLLPPLRLLTPSHDIRSRNVISWRIGLLFHDGEHETGLKPSDAWNIPRSNLVEARKSSRGNPEVSPVVSRGEIRIITRIFRPALSPSASSSVDFKENLRASLSRSFGSI